MSTICNYCTMKMFREAYKDAKIELIDDPMEFAPKGKKLLVNGKFEAWFMKLPEKCEC